MSLAEQLEEARARRYGSDVTPERSVTVAQADLGHPSDAAFTMIVVAAFLILVGGIVAAAVWA